MLERTAINLCLGLLLAGPAVAQPTIVLVRHAERADTTGGQKPAMAADPELSAAGRRRAESLAAMLKDANITEIFATEFRRTQQTAAPLAKTLSLTVKTIPSDKQAELLKLLKAATGNVLVVGHSNTIPDIIKALGVAAPVTIGDADFDNLFLVRLGSQPELIRLHYH
jgi:broad specificity phosphatase PhoE